MMPPAVRRWAHSLRPRPDDLKADVVASLPVAVSSVPDGMAAAALIGVNPVHGLYATVFGTIAGGMTATTSRMAIATTTASALAAGSVLSTVDASERPQALFLLTVLAGLLMIGAALLRLGRYTRFVSHSVMVGFLTGVSVSLVLGQVPDLAGASSDASTSITRFLDIVTHPASMSWPTLGVGAATLVLLVVLDRTPVGAFSSIVAIALPTAVAVAAGLAVARVDDGGALPRGLPLPALPELDLITLDLVVAAAAVAVIVLVQGFGVAQSVPEPGAVHADGNGDFRGQGIANVLSGLFQGQPVGGSVGQTALLRTSGARSRWGAIGVGLWMAVILLVLSPLIGYVATAALAAVLIYAGVTSVNVPNITAIWQTSTISRIALSVTFLATLALPVPVAVGVGVVVSLLLQLNQEAMDLTVVELVTDGDAMEERPPPARLRPEAVTLLAVHGSLFFAGARTLQAHLPDPGDAPRPVVVLRLRGRAQLGATALVTLGDYAGRLARNGGRLYLSGVSPMVMDQLDATGVATDGPLTAVPATDVLRESTWAAVEDATTWLVHGTPQAGDGMAEPHPPPGEAEE